MQRIDLHILHRSRLNGPGVRYGPWTRVGVTSTTKDDTDPIQAYARYFNIPPDADVCQDGDIALTPASAFTGGDRTYLYWR